MDLVRYLIEKYKVATMPGTTFGLEEGCYLRISYGALSKESVMEGMGRLVDGISQL